MDIQNIVSQFLEVSMKFAIAFVPLFIGVYIKENLDVINRKKRKIRVGNILVSSITVAFIVLGFISWSIEKYGLAFTVSLLFLLGFYSNKFIAFISNKNIGLIVLKIVSKTKKGLQETIIETIIDSTAEEKIVLYQDTLNENLKLPQVSNIAFIYNYGYIYDNKISYYLETIINAFQNKK